MDRKYVMTAFGYALLGMLLGMYMAESKNHGQFVTHTHILLIGFVLSFAYALCHKLWLDEKDLKLAKIQYYVHQAGSVLLFGGLFSLYGNFAEESVLGPIMGLGSFSVFVAALLMKVLLIRSGKRNRASSADEATVTTA